MRSQVCKLVQKTEVDEEQSVGAGASCQVGSSRGRGRDSRRKHSLVVGGESKIANGDQAQDAVILNRGAVCAAKDANSRVAMDVHLTNLRLEDQDLEGSISFKATKQ